MFSSYLERKRTGDVLDYDFLLLVTIHYPAYHARLLASALTVQA